MPARIGAHILLLARGGRQNRLGEAIEAYTAASKAAHDSTVAREAEKKIARLQRRLSKESAAARIG